MLAVTGASGQLGRLTLRLLLERVDAASVLALTRTPQRAADLGIATRSVDFDDADGLVPAFAGIERLLLISTNVFDTTGRRIRQHTNAIEAATKAGVEHIIYTSISRASDPAHPAAVARDHRVTETMLAESGVQYTMLRHSIYTQLVLAGIDVAVCTGKILDNSGDGATSYVTREDCAAVAAAVLAHGGFEGQRLEVTGPHALTQTDIAAIISEYTGVPVHYHPITDEAVTTDLINHGMDALAAREFATIGASVRAGYTSIVTDVVERITGHPPMSVVDLLTRNRRIECPHGRSRQ
jgi:NAD(P)H dehydrogenase (quinone)